MGDAQDHQDMREDVEDLFGEEDFEGSEEAKELPNVIPKCHKKGWDYGKGFGNQWGKGWQFSGNRSYGKGFGKKGLNEMGGNGRRICGSQPVANAVQELV